jgi:signal peptidase I
VLRAIRKNPVVDLILTLAMAVVIAYLVQLLVVKPFVVPSGSMIPTYEEGDHLLGVRFLYHLTDPSRGDIIVFHPNGSGDQAFRSTTVAEPYYVKRLIGMPGEEVGSHQGNVWVCRPHVVAADPASPTATPGCRYLAEPYVHGQKTWEYGNPEVDLAPIRIPPDQYLMLGDNRENSNDGRNWGTIRASQFRARAFMTYWPLNRISFY